MSVLKNKRHIAPTEYERRFDIFTHYLDNRIKRIPMRYYRELIRPFNDAIINCENDIAQMNQLFLQGKRESVERYRVIQQLIKDMCDIVKVSYTYWNISETKSSIKYVKGKSREYWAKTFNEVLNLVYKEAQRCHKFKEEDIEMNHMFAYPNCQKAEYIKEISNIQKLVARRSKRMNARIKDRNMERLLYLCSDALYLAYSANAIKIIDEKTKKNRVNKLDKAVGFLYEIDKPLRELAFDGVFTEIELKRIHESLSNAKKMTQAIKNTDKTLSFE